MEYLVVLFPRRRRVKINDGFNGYTNELIELDGGPYTVSLGPPPNFTPQSRDVDLRNTAPLTPMIVQFEESD
ncbi:MAG: hypothetical protein GWN84_14225 [Gammaproteobacteria bacterium]|nr:hypothetical protein [Gammaproteobacteria bacterium]NIR83956.1 hypothetical protein [Gammaproteobacteria bacterium]NIR88999.1 hypothetical protein [Gammaproteobacteria bacterium]NIV74552.1 hypothetical protein [Gammaproteobacteria bacterium]